MNSILLIIFLIYSIIIIFVDNMYILLSLLLLKTILFLILKINFKTLKSVIYFSLFIFIFNFILMNFNYALLISIRLLNMCLIVNIIIKLIGINNIAYTFARLFHSRDLYLIISIALTFIPILKSEILDIKKCLIVKNYSFNLINIIKNPKVLIITFFNNLFIRVKELEKTIIAKGY